MKTTESPLPPASGSDPGVAPGSSVPGREPALRANALGLLATAALTAAYMAPAASIYTLFGAMVSQVGVAVGFVMAIGMLMTLPSALSFGMLAREIPSAGGVYAWATRALGPAPGAGIGVTTACYYVLTVFFPPIMFGQFFNGLLDLAGLPTGRWTWLAGAVLALGLTAHVTYRGIVVSSRLAFTMLMTELAVVVGLGLTFLAVAVARGTFSWDPILPTAARGGASGIVLALPLAMLSMVCDAATPTSEETRNARRTIPVAVMTTCILIGVWYVIGFSAFALAAPQPELFALVDDESRSPISYLARRVWGRFDILVTITGMTAAIGALIPCATAASRVLYAMGRDGTLPGWLGAVHPRFQVPWNSLHVVFATTLLGVVPVAVLAGETSTIRWWGNVVGWYIAVVYVAANLSNIVYFRRFARDRAHALWNMVVPILGIGAQLLLVWQLVIRELWNQQWFGRSGQVFIVAATMATVAYSWRMCPRRSGFSL